ncbi:MAG: sigma-54-dependent Fis family transcriptional regulator, partial [Planctomycetes bacterium]|nr:sigma-54-dependent Fis family transcriptional regulator [Planctomycetota bacterium]
VRVDTRVIAATNRDLEAAIRETKFRDDLFYRLNVFPIVLPPLRRHKEDIPELMLHFLQRHGLSMESVAPEVADMLGVYDWPGNVRELENAIERAVIVAAGRPITPAAFPPEVRAGPAVPVTASPPPPAAVPAPETPSAPTPSGSMDERELEMIREAIRRAGGNKSMAAKALGITRRRLYSRLKSLEGRTAKG